MSKSAWHELSHAGLVDAKIFSRTESGHRVDVYVPDDVSSHTPILVMHDAKNLFWPEHSTMGSTWEVIDVVQGMPNRPIVLGVWGLIDDSVPGIRYFELAPQRVLDAQPDLWGSLLDLAQIKPHDLLGDAYHDMIAHVLIPEIAAEFGLGLERNRTAICGSSMGGLTSLYGASRYPDVYGTVLSLSTHWAYWAPEFIDRVLELLPVHPRPRVWIDRGTEELDALYEGLHERAADWLRLNGWDSPELLQARVYEGTNHSEVVWSQRLAEVIEWWLHGVPA